MVALEGSFPLRRALWSCLVAGVLGATRVAAQEPTKQEPTKKEKTEQEPAGEEQSCKCNPKRVGECFPVHGRLAKYKSAPTVRIWVVGTKRWLGLGEVPEWLGEDLEEGDNYLFADFVLCPLTRRKPGAMQLVCVESASNQVVEPRK